MPSKDESKYAPKAWSTRDFEFELPSGDLCLLRKMDPLELIEHGLMDKLDFATNVVMGTHTKNAQMSNVERVKRERARRQGTEEVVDADNMSTLKEIAQNPEGMSGLKAVLEQVLLLCVVAPKMYPPPDNDDDRVEGIFYTDTVPFNDKMAVFNAVMAGVKVVEQFREGPEETVGTVVSVTDVQSAAKRAPRNARKRTTS